MLKTIRIVVTSLLVLTPLLAGASTDHPISGEHPGAERLEPPLPPASAIAAGPSLAGKPWRLEELADKPLPGEHAPPHLLFMNNGDLVGFGGCNYFIGKYRTGADGRIIVSSLRASHQQCPDSSKQETTLLTSLVLADTVQLRDDELTFLMNGGNLMKLGSAADISVDELIQQGKLIKKQQARARKARGKKKKVVTKATGHGKTTTPKIPEKTRPVAKTPVKAN
jgi:heat shock protein HslJ